MSLAELISGASFLWSPLIFALLIGGALLLVWMAFAPSTPAQKVQERLDDYLDRGDIVTDADMAESFGSRAILPLFRGVLRALGRLTPKRNVEATELMLVRAGNPARLSAIDFYGLRLLTALVVGAIFFAVYGRSQSLVRGVGFTLVVALIGYLLPSLWLSRRARGRQHAIQRALPDALDMLTICVEAGLGFESALLRVSEQWINPLTEEFRRMVSEIRVGTPRDAALRRMADRSGVPDLNSFVAILIQSNQLGVSIADVLHAQAAQMRLRRRQRAEELARQAGVKMVFPLVFFVFPAMLIVILGPAIPVLINFLGNMTGAR
jgi:tight adherence protein C